MNDRKNKFLNKAKKLHPNKNYDYSKVVYINSKTKVEIFCPKCGNSFFSKTK
jgi:hypothetical protein